MQKSPEGKDGFDAQAKRIIKGLYADIEPKELNVTDRTADDYRRLLGLNEVPILPTARILDVGGGNANISAEDFGLQSGNLTRADVDPRRADIVHGNVLDLPFDDAEFDEVWASFVLKYVDPVVPLPVFSKVRNAEMTAGRGSYEDVITFLGLKAMCELLRVTKPGGRVRLASYVYDFDPKQMKSLVRLFEGIASGKVNGVSLNGTNVDSRSFSKHPKEQEMNLFLEKDESYNQEEFSRFLEEEYHGLVPSEMAAILAEA